MAQDTKQDHDVKWPTPFVLPALTRYFDWALNPSSMRLYNQWRYMISNIGEAQASIFNVLYPLNQVQNWNLLYGKSGLLQYHCCVPEACALTVYLKFITIMQQMEWFPYLAVLKKHGNPVAENINSFSIQGYSLALDFPNHSQTYPLFKAFDTLLLEHGGRIYLAKDACSDPRLTHLHPDTFSDDAFGSFQKIRIRTPLRKG